MTMVTVASCAMRTVVTAMVPVIAMAVASSVMMTVVTKMVVVTAVTVPHWQ